MSSPSDRLQYFARRVRLVRAWRGVAIGACIGGGIDAVWAVLDWRSIVYTEALWLAAVVAVCALAGGISGALLRVSIGSLVTSIDRRAKLDDRLATMHEREDEHGVFDSAQRVDAEAKLATVQPAAVYPISFSRLHLLAIGLAVVAAAVFMLGNTPIVMSESSRESREQLHKMGQTVERVTKQNFETPDAQAEMSDAEKKLADEMRRYNRDLEKAHISPADALQKANDLAKQAADLVQQQAKDSMQSLATADTARDDLVKSELEKAGMDGANPSMAQMSPEERDSKLAAAKRQGEDLAKQLAELKKQLADLEKRLADPKLSSAERKALEAQKKALEKQIAELNKEQTANKDTQKALELSKAAQDVFKKMMSDPLYKQLIELQKKLQQNAQAAANSGQPKMTDAEREEMKRELEALAERLKDEKAMKAYLQAMLDAMKKANAMGRCNNVGLGLNGMPSMPGMQAPAGPGAPTEDVWQGDTGQVHKLDHAEASQGKTTTDVVTGEQRPASGPQSYVEIRAPSTVGNRTSVPYRDVLPSYARRAESALHRQEIPKEQQERVKKYFESLNGPKKAN